MPGEQKIEALHRCILVPSTDCPHRVHMGCDLWMGSQMSVLHFISYIRYRLSSP